MTLHDFLIMGINITKFASMIYGVSKSKGEGLGFHEKCQDSKTLTWKKPSEPSSSSYGDKGLRDYFVSVAESIKVLNLSESITKKSKVVRKTVPKISGSEFLKSS